MSTTLSPAERDNTLALTNDQRYQYFIEMVNEQGEIWSLANHEGWVTVSIDGDNGLPVWPHADYARQWATDDWSDCTPKSIALDVWLKRWTKGLVNDESLLVVFPNLDEQAMLVDPEELEDDLLGG